MSAILRNMKHKIRNNWLFIIFLGIGILVRVLFFGNIPSGINQDEAFAGYEAYSLLHCGKDSYGYSFPCYFVSWGSVMNVLESYLAIPFVWIFGLSSFTIRLPQLIVGCFSLLIVYFLLEEVFDKKVALVGLGFLTICPWHIMLSRWGLESNLAPGFLLFGLFFLVKGLENNKYWVVSALMYGIALYAYAITWMVIPVTLAAIGAYLLLRKYKMSFKWIGISVLILAVLAFPLIWFFLANQNFLPEIRTSFFSVPKLVFMRDAEVSVRRLFSIQAYKDIIKLLVFQSDGLIWNTPEHFGLFYMWTMPLAVLGGCRMLQLAFVRRDEKSDKRI